MAPARRSSRMRKRKIIPDMVFEDKKSSSPNVVALSNSDRRTRKKKGTEDEQLPVVPKVAKPQMKPKRGRQFLRGTDKQAMIQEVVEQVINAARKTGTDAEAQIAVPTVSKRGRKSKGVGVVTDEQASSQVVLQQQSGVKRGPGRPRKSEQIATDSADVPRPKRRYRKRVKVVRPPTVILNPEELEEHIFQEQIKQLSAVNEAIRLANVEQLLGGSDVESNDGDGDIDDIDESDEELVSMKEDDPTCPRPAPRKGRGGHKYLKRNQDALVSQEEVQGMCRILSKSIRTTLSGGGGGCNISVNCDPLDTENVERDKPSFAEVIKNEPDTALYRKLLRTLEVQDDWLKKKLSTYSSNPDLKELRMLNLKNTFEHQVYLEHLSCLTVLAKQPNPAIVKNGMLSWFPKFERSCKARYSQLMKYEAGDSDTKVLVHKVLYVATLKTTTTMGEVLESLNSARIKLLELMELVDAVSHDKRLSCIDFEQIHDALQLRHAKFDESSVWGIKPIRLALEPPYFKTDDGLLAAPLIQNPIRQIPEYSMCFFKRDKQKWTTKDLQQLKTCIKETLYSKRMSALYDRYEVLLTDCISQYEQDIKNDGRLDAPPLETKRKRGRPKKSEMELTEKYGIIYPVIAVLPNGAIVRNRVSPKLLSEWRTAEEKKLKTKSYDELVFMENGNIDWDSVAVKMVLKSRKHRNAEDCELAFRHEIHPLVNDKRWGVEESRRLKEIYTRQGNDWPAVADELQVLHSISNRTARTAYQCFFRVRNRIEPPKKLAWNDTLDQQVLDNLKEHPGNWRLVAAKIDDPGSTKRQVIERYKKTINPVLRNGAFTRVEDCLLILTIEKLKPFLAKEGHFGCLVAYLPWRCETTWRDRANNLFSDWIVPWTLEEDQMLLDLAISMNRNWQKISEEFTSFKNRKGCLTRYKILKRRLKDERFNNSLEAYHEAYAMTRYNVFQYKHLKEILELLTKVKDNPLPKEHMTFPGLLRDREPSEVRLQHMLLTFDQEILASVICSLSRYVETRDHYWQNWIIMHGKRKRTFDRRTFHPDNPQSVASALHIRGLVLRNKEDIPNINDFEDEIYKFYGRFKRTKPLKATTDRPYIPDAKTLANWSTVSRLIDTPLDELEDVPVKRKWKSLKNEGTAEPPNKKKSTVARAKKIVKKRKVRKVVRPVVQPKRRGRRPRKTVLRVRVKTPPLQFVPQDNSDPGYILIPELEHSIKGRVRPQMKDNDPEFVAVLKTEPIDEQPGSSGLRRSSRGSTRRWNYIDENVDYSEEEDMKF